MAKKGMVVTSPVGELPLDHKGSAIGVVRMDPELSYLEVPELLQEVINQGSDEAWAKIRSKTDYTHTCLSHALDALEAEIGFSNEIKARVEQGQKLLFKPNLVSPDIIDRRTHGRTINNPVCTAWPFVAAVMRWFHDRLGITYHQMSLAEGATGIEGVAAGYTRALAGKAEINTLAVTEGRVGNFYGGWAFYFVRKYLADCHDPDHTDDPMNGYQESVSGVCLPPGRARDKLLVYDLNKIQSDLSNGREVPVADGVNFRTITLHKSIVGGDPKDPEDREDWPGCVLINLPKLKIHQPELITGAIKNIGIGVYPMEFNVSKEPGKICWLYSTPQKPVPGLKSLVPHSRLMAEVDEDTNLPLRDKNGEYIIKKTGGMAPTMADALVAIRDQGIHMFHVVDAVETANVAHFAPLVTPTLEGMAFAAADPVALDLLCARYLFTTVPMEEARTIQKEKDLPSDFMQRVPIPKANGQNIVTGEGVDSPISRYNAFQHCEERGLGQQSYYVLGRDECHGGELASLEQHLGRVEGNTFSEVLTSHMYYTVTKFLWCLQATTFAYAETNDSLTGSSYKRDLLDTYDVNGDGIIDYDECAMEVFIGLQSYLQRLPSIEMDHGERRKMVFLMAAVQLGCVNPKWNPDGHDFGKEEINKALGLAMRMSQATAESSDPLTPNMTWGKGKWPSLQFAIHLSLCNRIYGPGFPKNFDIFNAPYGNAFRYADMKWADQKYYGQRKAIPGGNIVAKYHDDVAQGMEPLPFTFYVPAGFGSAGNGAIPNVKETDNPNLIFTADFDGGRESWRELSLSSFP